MKKVFLFIAGAWMAWASHAEGNKGKWWQDIKQNTTFGGYVIGKAAFNDQDLDNKNESHSTFDIRLIRAYVNGKVWDFRYGLQMEMASRIGRLGGMGKILFRQSEVRTVQARLHLRESHESLGYRFRGILPGYDDAGRHERPRRGTFLQRTRLGTSSARRFVQISRRRSTGCITN